MGYNPKQENPKMCLYKFWYTKDNIEFSLLHCTKTGDIKEIFLEAFQKGSKLDARLLRIDELYHWKASEMLENPIPGLSKYGKKHLYEE